MRKMAGFGIPASPPPPDLSNLTEQEKQIIQSVLQRQKQMEDETLQLQRNLQKEVESYQTKVERKTGPSDYSREDSVCEVCHKTKFTDGSGKECKYCKLKVCARCGVQVTIPGSKQTSPKVSGLSDIIQGQGLSLFSNLIQDFKTLALGPEVSWVCVVCQKKQEMLTKTGNWFGSLTAPNEKVKANNTDALGSDFRAIPTEEDKRAMRRQANSLLRSDSGRGSGRREKAKDSEQNRVRRPSVSDEEVDQSPSGSPAYMSDDELYRHDENKVRRKVVTFKGHDESGRLPQGRYPGEMQNRSAPLNQGPGRGGGLPGQGLGARSGPQHPQGGVRATGMGGGPPPSGMLGPGNYQYPQQQGSSFTPVGPPAGASPSSRPVFPSPQQQSPRGGISLNQPRPGFGMRGPPGPQQQRIQSPQQQGAAGYGRGNAPGSQAGVSPSAHPGQPGYGRGSPGVQPTIQYNLGPRPGAYGPSGSKPQGGLPANHLGGPQKAPGSPRPVERTGTFHGPRAGGPQGMNPVGPRFGPGAQPLRGIPPDQQAGKQQHTGQTGSPRQGQAPPGHLSSPRSGQVSPGQFPSPRMGQVLPGQLSSPRQGQVPPGQSSSPRQGHVSPRPGQVTPGQLSSFRQGQVPGQLGSPRDGQIPSQSGTPRQGLQLDQQARGHVGSPHSGPPGEQMSSPRIDASRSELGTPQQAPFPGQVDTSREQTRGRSGPHLPEQGLGRHEKRGPPADQSRGYSGSAQQALATEHTRGPFGNKQSSPVEQPRGQFRSPQQAPVMDQGRQRLGSPEKGSQGQPSIGPATLDSRSVLSQEARGIGAYRF